MKKKYFTEEERIAARREASRRSYQKHKEERKEAQREKCRRYKARNKEKIAEYNRQYRQEHKEEILEYQKQYQQEHKEKCAEYNKQYSKTPIGRANKLKQLYKRMDKNAGRGKCTLTAKWIVENIFTQKCHWCPETDWHKLGCDRIDNELPHTPDNVIPCCYECNVKRHKKSYEEFKKEMGQELT